MNRNERKWRWTDTVVDRKHIDPLSPPSMMRTSAALLLPLMLIRVVSVGAVEKPETRLGILVETESDPSRIDDGDALELQENETQNINETGTGDDDLYTNTTVIEVDAAIVGGNKAATGEFPGFVWGKGCGGSLIASDVVLTSAHCEGDAFKSKVLVGAVRVNKEKDGAQWSKVLKTVKHPNYDESTANFDFMVVKIEPVTNSGLKLITINKNTSFPERGQWLTVIGFGDIGTGRYSKRLRKAGVKVRRSSTCSSAYPNQITSSMLCASAPGKDACMGDSGGPLLGGGSQVGIVSWGKGCALESYPGVYARVSAAADWIESQVCKLSSSPPKSC